MKNKGSYKLTDKILYFVNNGSMHGLRYLGERCGVKGKFFWIIILTASVLTMTIVLHLTSKYYEEETININLDTSYLHWENTFPAVAFCFHLHGFGIDTTLKIRQFIRQYWASNNILEPKKDRFFHFIMEYIFYNGQTNGMDIPPDLCDGLNSSCNVNITYIKERYLSCSLFISNITFLGGKVYENCESIFKLIETEMGTCFIANGLASHDFDADRLPLKYNRLNPYRTLNFKYIGMFGVTFYILSPEDVPHLSAKNTHELLFNEYHYYIYYQTIEMKNSDDLIFEPIEKRNCRFPMEKLPGSSMPYSFSSCLAYHRIKAEIKYCNCTPHTSPIEYKDIFCTIKQLSCITKHSIMDEINYKLHNKEIVCLQSCVEMQIDQVGEYNKPYDNSIISPYAFAVGRTFTKEELSSSNGEPYVESETVFNSGPYAYFFKEVYNSTRNTKNPNDDQEVDNSNLTENLQDEYDHEMLLSNYDFHHSKNQNNLEAEIKPSTKSARYSQENKIELDVNLEIINNPTVRYIRNVSMTKLDFIVVVGGIVGLFIGASLLTVLEFLYISFIRKF